MSIPEMPEDATYDELLCNSCYSSFFNEFLNVEDVCEEEEAIDYCEE